MKIHVLIAARNYTDVPEVLDAWDEYVIDSNPEGWETAKEEAIAELEEDEGPWREVVIEVPGLESFFDQIVLKGKLVEEN